MFQPATDKVDRARPITKATKINASVKGWHMNEPVSNMDPDAATQLENLFPEPGGLRLRYGYQQWAVLNGQTGQTVEALMTYLSGSTRKLFAACNHEIFDATAAGTTGAAVLGGLGGTRFQWINFATPAGQFLVAANGVDTVLTYGPSGTGGALQWQASAITGPTNPIANLWSFMGHLFLVEQFTDIIWWLPANQISGTAQQIPMGSMLYKGGKMVAGGQWTYATGSTIINLCVMISSEGEVVVYSGTDPSSASTWSKVGQFTIGRPIGYRCTLAINSDLVVLCQDGLMLMSKAIQYDRTAMATQSLTWNIQKAFSDAYQNFSQNFGWQMIGYAWGHMALINVPSGPAANPPGNWQFVQDSLTGAWCRYLNLDAISWAVLEDQIFFGDRNGLVWQAETGSVDKGGSSSPQPISGGWVSAYNDLDAPGRLKNAKAIRVVFLSDSPLIVALAGVSTDYNFSSPHAVPTIDSSLSGATQASWVAAIGEGYQMAATIGVQLQSAVPTQNYHVYITASYILNEAGGWMG